MNIPVFIPMFIALGIFYLFLGIVVSKKISNVKDYFLAGRDLGLVALTFTLVATQIGGGMLLGSANAAYVDGYLGIFYSLGMSVGFLLLGFGLASRLRQFEVATSAELFEVWYGSPFLRKIASLVSAVSMMGIFAAQVVASRALFNVLGIGSEGFLIFFWFLVIIYTVMGGLKAVVATDMFQVVFLIFIVTGIFLYTIFFGGGTTVSTGIVAQGVRFTSFGAAFLKQLPILVTSAIYPLFGQDLVQRFFAARTKKIAAASALLASFIVVAFAFVPVYFGMKAKYLGLAIPANTSVFYAVVKALTNNFVVALVGCALIAAITSTADSLLCAISSNVIQDFGGSTVRLSDKKRLFLSKVVTFVAGGVGMGIAYYSENILFVLSQSYGLLISCLFIPILFCLKGATFHVGAGKAEGDSTGFVRGNLLSAKIAVFSGALSFVALEVGAWLKVISLPEIFNIMIPIAVSLLGYLAGTFFKD